MKALVFGLGASVFSIGLTALIGYAISVTRMFTWDTDGIGMALNTAIATTLTGLALCVLSSRVCPGCAIKKASEA